MAKNHYTLLIVPRKKSSVKKISASSALIKGAAVAATLLLMGVAYFCYDYVKTKTDEFELVNLKRLTQNQKEQIHSLASKVNDFEKRMEDMKQLDQKIRSIANLEKRSANHNRQILGIGGTESESEVNKNSVTHIQHDLDRLVQDASDQENSFTQLLELLKKRESILAATPSLWPVRGWVTSEFGRRDSPFDDQAEFHKGIDIASRIGNEVHAPADGIVAEVVNRSDMGNYVIIDHLKGISTGFAHLLKSAAIKGQRVKRGEVIGYVGSSGRSTGSHLHYSVSLNGVPVNPRSYLQ